MKHGLFCDVVGVTARNKALECFLEMDSLDFGLGDIAHDSNLSRAETYIICKQLLKEKLIVKTRKVGRTQLYQLADNLRTNVLLRLFKDILMNWK